MLLSLIISSNKDTSTTNPKKGVAKNREKTGDKLKKSSHLKGLGGMKTRYGATSNGYKKYGKQCRFLRFGCHVS